jgi:hypothetical protein
MDSRLFKVADEEKPKSEDIGAQLKRIEENLQRCLLKSLDLNLTDVSKDIKNQILEIQEQIKTFNAKQANTPKPR